MVQQNILPFKLEKTNDLITANAGLALLGEFAVGLGLPELINQILPKPGSSVGYQPSEHVMPLILMLNGGGRSLEDLREIRNDSGLRELLKMENMPSSDATGNYLRRSGDNGALEDLASVNAHLLKKGMKNDGLNGYTLDIDATAIAAEKKDAHMTYKGFTGYMPIVGHLAENGFVIGDEFREGNEAPASRNLEFIQYCEQQLPEGKRIDALRADSASYQADIINYCFDNNISFAIGGVLDKAVVSLIDNLRDSEWRPYQDGFIAETVHCMNETHHAFQLIVIRRPVQEKLFEDGEETVKYTVISADHKGSAEEVVKWYNQRGDKSENRIKELKIGFGMERMPCGQFTANAVFFRIGVIAYNLGRLFVLKTQDASWHRYQVQTIRWKLYHTAGKVVFHGGAVWLKVKHGVCGLFEKIQIRSQEFAFN